MRYQIFSVFTLSAVLFSAACPAVADDLDAALEARKKTVRQHVYSEKAQLDDRNLLVPKTPTEEERALDRKLKQLESSLNNPPATGPAPAARRPSGPVPVPKGNWLTPALLDPDAAENLSVKKAGPSWVREELDRQKTLQEHKDGLAREEALVNKILREDSRKSSSATDSPLKQYESALRNTISPGIQPAARRVLSTPFESISQKEKSAVAERTPRFFPAARVNSGVIRPSSLLSPSQPRPPSTPPVRWTPQAGASKPKQAASPFAVDWNAKKPTPLSPVERVRRSSPIYRKDPFSDDFMPGLKNNIWD